MADRPLALAPNATSIEGRVLVALGKRDLAGARHVVENAAKRVNQDELLAYLAYYRDLGWVPADAGQRDDRTLGGELLRRRS